VYSAKPPADRVWGSVLVVHSSDELYGSDLALLSWLRHLAGLGARVCVVLPNERYYSGELSRELRRAGVEVYHLPLAVLRRGLNTPRGMLHYLRRLVLSTALLMVLIVRRRVDLVHSSTLAVLPGAFAAALLRRRHVWHVMEIIRTPVWLTRLYRVLVPRLSSIVVAASGPVRDHLLGGRVARYGHKVRVVWLGRELPASVPDRTARQAARRLLEIPDDALLVGVVGRISGWKGQATFLRAAARVHQTQPGVHFAVVGGTTAGREVELERLRVQARTLGIDTLTRITGYRADAAQLMPGLDVLVLPSTAPEPFGLVVLEAMAAARPVVAFAHGGPTELIEDGVSGLLVPPTDEAQLAAAIERLLTDAGLLSRMGQAARERAVSVFGLGQYLGGMEGAYRAAGLRMPTGEPDSTNSKHRFSY
jgi:glycosyltransferase involved in cell wall biosynthesis